MKESKDIHEKNKVKNGSVVSSNSGSNKATVKHKRRYCKTPGCDRIVKSQGLCQRHGAKPRKCKRDDCDKQAQGNFDGMCKTHFKEHRRKVAAIPSVPDIALPPPADGESVYELVLPASINFVPNGTDLMPLVGHLKAGFDTGKPSAWHRNEERRARGLWPIQNPATQLEGWERELVWNEILVLSGTSNVSFRHLARGWGRDKGFHMVLAQFICDRRGDVERKKRKKGTRRANDENSDSKSLVGQLPSIFPSVVHARPSIGELAVHHRFRGNSMSSAPLADNGITRDVLSNEGFSEELKICAGDVWDETCYNGFQYNEDLVVDLFPFTSTGNAKQPSTANGAGQSAAAQSTAAQSAAAQQYAEKSLKRSIIGMNSGNYACNPNIMNNQNFVSSQQQITNNPGMPTLASMVNTNTINNNIMNMNHMIHNNPNINNSAMIHNFNNNVYVHQNAAISMTNLSNNIMNNNYALMNNANNLNNNLLQPNRVAANIVTTNGENNKNETNNNHNTNNNKGGEFDSTFSEISAAEEAQMMNEKFYTAV